MNYVVSSVYDVACCAFGRPVFTAALGQAVRSFSDEINRAVDGNVMYDHPEHFQLFQLGSFDDQSGLFTLLALPTLCSVGSDVKLPR